MKKVNHVGIVLDRSGSMGRVKEEALTGLNEELELLEKEADENEQETTVTLTTFSTKVDESRTLERGQRVFYDEYKCSGWTALADAIAANVEALQKIETNPDEDVAYLVTIVTDGFENQSKLNTMRDISVMIKTLEGQGNWTFVFMGCDKNVLDVAKSLNVSVGNTTVWSNLDYGQTLTSGKLDGYKKFYKHRGAGGQSIRNFSS